MIQGGIGIFGLAVLANFSLNFQIGFSDFMAKGFASSVLAFAVVCGFFVFLVK